MRCLTHRADGPQVLRGGFEQRPRRLAALLLRDRLAQPVAPVLQVADQRRRLLAEFAIGLVVPGPMVPQGDVPARPVRVEPVRDQRKEDVGHLVGVPERHLHLVGLGPFRLQAPLHRFQAHVDAHFPPVVAHQFHGDRLRRLEVQVLEGYRELGAVRVFPQSIAVHVVQAQFVQQRPGVVRVVAAMRLREAVLVPAARRMRRHLARHTPSEVDHLVHLVPVDGMGQRADEPALALAPEQFAVLRIVVVVVGLDGDVADVDAMPDVDFVEALRLAELEQRNVLGLERESREVELPGGGLEGDHLGVLEQDDRVDGIDVGQLVPRRVYLEVVGVAFQAHLGRRPLNDLVGPQGRHLHRLLVAPAPVRAVHRHPGDEALLFDQGGELLPVPEGRVELLEEVHRVDEVAAVLGEEVGEHRVGFGETVLEGQVVDLHELAALHQPVHDRRHLGIHPDVVQAEPEVVGRQRHPVGPLDARAQPHRGDAAVFAQAPGRRQVGQHVAHVRRQRQRVLPVEELPTVPDGYPRRAAVPADGPVGLDDHRIVRQALPHRRQVAVIEVGTLGEGRDAQLAGGLRRLVPRLGPVVVPRLDGDRDRRPDRDTGERSARPRHGVSRPATQDNSRSMRRTHLHDLHLLNAVHHGACLALASTLSVVRSIGAAGAMRGAHRDIVVSSVIFHAPAWGVGTPAISACGHAVMRSS